MDAAEYSDLSTPTSVKLRSRSSLMRGSRGAYRAKKRSLQTWVAEANRSVRRACGALVQKPSGLLIGRSSARRAPPG